MEKSHGIITRLVKLTETSLIVYWCTREHGLIKAVAKGARRPKSPFAGKLDLFYSADIAWVRSRKSELHTLREVALTDCRENLRLSYRDTLVASYFGELLDYVAEKDHPIPELFDLLQRGLGYITNSGADQRALLHFESELAKLLGISQSKNTAHLALARTFGDLPRIRKTCLSTLQPET